MTNKNLDLKRLMYSIASLVDLGQEVTSSKDMAEQMKASLYVVAGTFSVPTAALLMYNRQRKKLQLLTQKGHKENVNQDLNIPILPRNIKEFLANQPHVVSDAAGGFIEQNKELFSLLQAKIFVPLFARDEFVGALVLGRKLGRGSYRQGDKEILRVIAHQMAMMLHNARLFWELARKATENRKLYESMRRIYHNTIQAFSAAIDAKDEYTKDHSYRVATYAVAIARELGWKKKDVEGIYVAGLLHDIGKIIIDTKLIQKGEKLTDLEITEMKKHPQVSYAILSKINFPWKNIEQFVRHHHERLDGKGYPDSLIEHELSEGEKILALADAFDAMTTDRPYRKKMELEEAVREIVRCSGSQFDQKITNTFLAAIRKELNGDVHDPRILPLLQKPEANNLVTITNVRRLSHRNPGNLVAPRRPLRGT